MKREKVELLAPAGNLEAFLGAIHAGADAVYLGGDKFGARAYADNFNTDELCFCIRYAHILGRKVYLTVNTLVKDKEWHLLYRYVQPFYEAGLDGVIIQDMGVFLYLKRHFPEMEFHVSTQMTLTGSHGASYMKKLGACRIVPARELCLDEIKQLKQDTGLELETFIHGAMCYCYSGQCLFSSILGGRSGNRGRCAQPCRLPYRVEMESGDREECYPLSLKDLCTIEYLPELIEAGIDSFKIEGRMKKAEYAAGVTAIYRQVIDRYYQDPKHWKVDATELKMLSSLYIRSERQDGYYHKHNGAEMVTLKDPSYSGSDDTLLKQIREKYIDQKRKMPLDIYARFAVGEPAALTLVCGIHSVTVPGEMTAQAQKQPITEDTLKKQLHKLGDTVFEPGETFIDMEGAVFYSLKAINELRRKAVRALEDCLIAAHGLTVCRKGNHNISEAESKGLISHKAESIDASIDNVISVSISTTEQLQEVLPLIFAASEGRKDRPAIRKLYVEGDVFLKMPESLEALEQMGRNNVTGCEIYLTLPYILRKRDHSYLEQIKHWLSQPWINGCMVRSLEGYAWLKTISYRGRIVSDSSFYIWNRETLAYWQSKLDAFTLPWELNAGEQKDLLSVADILAEKVVYGYIPMMITANCVMRTTDRCYKENGWQQSGVLIDRYQKKLPVVANCLHCMNIIYNSVPISLHHHLDQWKKKTVMRLQFTVESGKETRQIFTYFLELLNGKAKTPPYKEFTTGHEKRGVE